MVVYLLVPTSNHNLRKHRKYDITLYIFWFLHQTTTEKVTIKPNWCCISFGSYIKPQLRVCAHLVIHRCISFGSYIKPQPGRALPSVGMRCISFGSYIKPQQVGI